MKRLIALDIDGTITVDLKPAPQPVVDYLHDVVESGWTVAFITGRTFHMGYEALKDLNFPFYYAFQNGAAILHMPGIELVRKKYLSNKLFSRLAGLSHGLSGGLIIYSGYELQDRCYYLPKSFDPPLLNHLLERTRIFKEEWVPVESLEEIPLIEFPVIKFFGDESSAITMSKRINDHFSLDVSVIRDPYNQKYSLMQATAPGINKGQALIEIKELAKIDGLVIAVGDDHNDLPMFEQADFCIAMGDAPDQLKKSAALIAPPASQMGIIEGLKLALKQIEG